MAPINTLGMKRNLFYLKTHFLPSSKHSVSVIKTDQLILYKTKVVLCSEFHAKHINAVCGPGLEFVNAIHGASTREAQTQMGG